MAQPKPKKARMALGELTVHNVKQLKLINSLVLPVSYSDKTYNEMVASEDLARLAYYDDIVVGGVCCRVQAVPDSQEKTMYIMTLACLATYRRLGLGTLMLNHVIKLAKENPAVSAVELHVQTGNDDAMKFYEKFGFTVKERIPDYYKKVTPAAAVVLRLDIKNEKEADAKN